MKHSLQDITPAEQRWACIYSFALFLNCAELVEDNRKEETTVIMKSETFRG